MPTWFALADLILIPLNPTPADLRALVKGLPLVKRSGTLFQFILARVRANLKNNEGAAMALEALGLVLPVRMHERVIYADTFAHGKTALETDLTAWRPRKWSLYGRPCGTRWAWRLTWA